MSIGVPSSWIIMIHDNIADIYIYYHPRIKLKHQPWFRSRCSIGSFKISASENGVYPKITIFTGEYEWIWWFPYFFESLWLSPYISNSRFFGWFLYMISDDLRFGGVHLEFKDMVPKAPETLPPTSPLPASLHARSWPPLAGRQSLAGREIPQKWRFLAGKIIYKYYTLW